MRESVTHRSEAEADMSVHLKKHMLSVCPEWEGAFNSESELKTHENKHEKNSYRI